MPVKHPNPKLANQEHYYKTPPSCTQALLDHAYIPKDKPVWECACGDGAISDVLIANGYETYSTELLDRGYGGTGIDFLGTTKLLAPTIITNPPFKYADEFVMHGFDLGAEKIFILQRLAWLESTRRYMRLWNKDILSKVWVFSGRQTLWRGDDPDAKTTGGAVPFAWFEFEKNSFIPEIEWIV